MTSLDPRLLAAVLVSDIIAITVLTALRDPVPVELLTVLAPLLGWMLKIGGGPPPKGDT